MIPTTPPAGRAISGSIVIPAIGRNANKTITVSGAEIDAQNEGRFSSLPFVIDTFSATTARYFRFRSGTNKYTVTTRPIIAGITFADITDDSGASKFSAAIIVLGLGEMMLPHLPPPTIASNNGNFEIPILSAMIMAIGATVITATSINTPTPVSNIVESANAKKMCREPSLLIIVCEIEAAAPVLIRTPESTPAAIIRIIAGVISFTPEIIFDTVLSRPRPPIKPPITAPKSRLYTGENLRIINTIANINPTIAPTALIISISFLLTTF